MIKIEYGKTYNALHFNFKSSDESLPDSKKLNTDIWYDKDTFLWLKAAFNKTGYWEYRLKNIINNLELDIFDNKSILFSLIFIEPI